MIVLSVPAPVVFACAQVVTVCRRLSPRGWSSWRCKSGGEADAPRVPGEPVFDDGRLCRGREPAPEASHHLPTEFIRDRRSGCGPLGEEGGRGDTEVRIILTDVRTEGYAHHAPRLRRHASHAEPLVLP